MHVHHCIYIFTFTFHLKIIAVLIFTSFFFQFLVTLTKEKINDKFNTFPLSSFAFKHRPFVHRAEESFVAWVMKNNSSKIAFTSQLLREPALQTHVSNKLQIHSLHTGIFFSVKSLILLCQKKVPKSVRSFSLVFVDFKRSMNSKC